MDWVKMERTQVDKRVKIGLKRNEMNDIRNDIDPDFNNKKKKTMYIK